MDAILPAIQGGSPNRTMLLDHYDGATKVLAHTDGDGNLALQTVYEPEPYVEGAARLRELPVSSEFRLAAVIPPHVLEQSFREGWFHDKRAWKRWANDPNNRKLRVWGGRL